MPLRNAARDYASETPFGGFRFVADADGRKQRVFWILVVITCVGGAVVQGVLATHRFITMKPSTSITVERQREIQLPNPIVCLPVHLDKARVTSLAVPPDVSDFVEFGFISKLGEAYLDNGNASTELAHAALKLGDMSSAYYRYIEQKNMTYGELADSLAFAVDDVFQTCYTELEWRDCTKVSRRLWLWAGTCFELAAPTQYLPGHMDGVMIDVRMDTERYYQNTALRAYHRGDAAYLLLSTNGEIGMAETLIPPASIVNIGLETNRVKYLPNGYCSDKQRNDPVPCILRCGFNILLGQCGCSFIDGGDRVKRGNKICDPMEVAACLIRSFKDGGEETSHIAKSRSECSEQCKPPCTKLEHHVTISSVPILNQTAFTRLHIFHKTMEIVQTEQFYGSSIPELFGLLGGLLGLWLGGSVVAFVHLLAYWARGCLSSNNNATSKRRIQSV